ncbi:hypothetical protein PWR63_04615 [Paraburkholderia sp. A2WS-5]|uniref:hypothetical protein n=1 Tax=Paraburkholderia sp. A2WS-5 TaxID=3028372 RepID=UPI003B76E638
MKDLNAWTAAGMKNVETAPPDHALLHLRLQRAEAEVRRLNNWAEVKERQLCELRSALGCLPMVHASLEAGLQQDLGSLRIVTPVEEAQAQWNQSSSDGTGPGVVVRLPYVTSILSVLFDAMYTFWADCDHDRPPKSLIVAQTIDERLGFNSQLNGEASRSAQAYASAIRPDWVKEADNRHHCRPRGRR